MGEEAITSGRQKALREATILLDLAIIRSRGSHLDAGLRSRSGGRKAAKLLPWRVGWGVVALHAEVVELRAAIPIETAISARDLPERKSRWHLHPSRKNPPYGPPAVGGGRSDRAAHARRGEGERACP
jgi:hypothetical protein